jgi:hypothetical protein
MKKPFTIALALVAALSAPGFSNEKDAKGTLDRAIKAHGGATALAKAVRSKHTVTGTHNIQGRNVPFVSQVSRELPDRVRLAIDLDKGTLKNTVVLDGDKAYANDGGTTQTLLPARVKELREEAYVDWVTTLAPLSKTEFTLSSLEKSKVNGEAAVGITASKKGSPDVNLYFSEKTGLLIKIAWTGTQAGLKVEKERHFSAHKEFDGVKLHTKETAMVNGKKFTEFTISEVSFPKKFDSKTFAKP